MLECSLRIEKVDVESFDSTLKEDIEDQAVASMNEGVAVIMATVNVEVKIGVR